MGKRTRTPSARAAEAQADGSWPKPERDRMRACTLDIRLAQVENRLLVQEVRHDSDQKKLVEEAEMADMWRRKAEELEQKYADQKKETWKWRKEARMATLGERERELAAEVESLKQQVAELKEDARNAWNMCTATEREKRRLETNKCRELQVVYGVYSAVAVCI